MAFRVPSVLLFPIDRQPFSMYVFTEDCWNCFQLCIVAINNDAVNICIQVLCEHMVLFI